MAYHTTRQFFIQNYQDFSKLSKWVSDASKLILPESITTLSPGALGLDTALWLGRLDVRGGKPATTDPITPTQAPRNKQKASSNQSEH
jgi:hypothetical protein